MSGEHQGLQRENQRLQPEDQGMHQRHRIHRMKEQPPPGADVFVGEEVMIVGVRIGNA
jgi:hypothetical protein